LRRKHRSIRFDARPVEDVALDVEDRVKAAREPTSLKRKSLTAPLKYTAMAIMAAPVATPKMKPKLSKGLTKRRLIQTSTRPSVASAGLSHFVRAPEGKITPPRTSCRGIPRRGSRMGFRPGSSNSHPPDSRR